jgi:hypothetical protein
LFLSYSNHIDQFFALFIFSFVISKDSAGEQATIYVDEPTIQESNYSSEEKLTEA